MNWENNIRKVDPYIPGEQPKNKVIKLNTNECPYPPSPNVKIAAADFDTNLLRLYPDPNASDLVNCLAQYYKINKEQVFVGVGSDDVLALAFLTFFHSEEPILFPDITYSFYDVWAELYNIPYEKPELDENFRMKPQDYMRKNGGIIFPNPNAPTGVLETMDTIEEIVRKNQESVVIVDEAYIDFGGNSCLELIEKYENLLVVQTFSKSRAMAGIRIGFAMGSKKLISYLNDVKFSFNSYTLNMPSLALGVEVVKDDEYFQETVVKIKNTRERVKIELKKLGFIFPESFGNFVFVMHQSRPARELFEALKKEGIYVRYFDKPRIDNYLRITIGTDQEMNQLLAFLRDYLEK